MQAVQIIDINGQGGGIEKAFLKCHCHSGILSENS